MAVYQQEGMVGSGSSHHTAILCPFRSAFAFFGVADVLPCSMRRRRFQAACVRCQA